MNTILNNDEIKKIKDAHKPNLLIPIITTLICFGPIGNMWLDVMAKDYSRIMLFSTMSVPLLIIVGIIWTRFSYQFMNYKKELGEYQEDPKGYKW